MVRGVGVGAAPRNRRTGMPGAAMTSSLVGRLANRWACIAAFVACVGCSPVTKFPARINRARVGARRASIADSGKAYLSGFALPSPKSLCLAASNSACCIWSAVGVASRRLCTRYASIASARRGPLSSS